MRIFQKLVDKWPKKAKSERVKKTPTMNEWDRKAAALAAKELENFWNYEGDEQQPIDVALL